MGELQFNVYKVSSEFGDWLAAFENDELIFLGSYGLGKKLVEGDLAELFHKNYGFAVGSFTPAKWKKGNFWNTKHKIKLQGTEFQMKVWLQLLKIPHGETVTYSDLAKKLRKPSAVRAVASAVAKNPISYWIPCHRVVGKNSNLFKYHWGPKVKQQLLFAETLAD
ncbi:methylated-DNA--[protein]-cysteine S-methyltransferase [Bdellovibrio sp. 22V]|uniref:methylated-DNA--[protein]-cysteine S-methyltransferase n=1 Tax=Bdellovibrio TaxID=958 RepID=UPI002543E543|nr:methylated-DNA--[protein]-cysteine S-methyltransferase [Bdellovibrio sp. 22V]WII72228.1 methylated-DNA--[protein]-cysteine S-methyltransferase [Bdellovibrio sp. 22V]